jgi:hypothetical protein
MQISLSAQTASLSRKPFYYRQQFLGMNPEKEEYELPEWVKLVNKLLYGTRKWDDEKRDFDRGYSPEEA